MTTNIQNWQPTPADLSEYQQDLLKSLSADATPLKNLMRGIGSGLMRACDYLLFWRAGWITGSDFNPDTYTHENIVLTALGQQARDAIEQRSTFRFLYFEYIEGETCQNCGHHPITRCFHIEHIETGRKMHVGSECIVSLLKPDDVPNFKTADRRLNRAFEQWQRQNPPALDGETQGAYVTRRVKEMGKAMDAHKEWTAARAETAGYNQLMGEDYSFTEHLKADIEKHYGANRYDFDDKTWNVRKV